MVRHCIVRGCNNRKRHPISTVHAFPNARSRPIVRQNWIKTTVSTSDQTMILENYGVCANHFMPEDYGPSFTDKKCKLNPLAVPSLGLNDDTFMDVDDADELNAIPPEVLMEMDPTGEDRKKESQFNSDQIIHGLKLKLKSSQSKVLQLSTVIKSLRQQLTRTETKLLKSQEETTSYENLLQNTFSKNQLRLLTGDVKNYVHWDDDEISKFLALYSVSVKAYNFIREVWKYPLPSDRTLRRWLKKIEICPGKLIQPVMRLLEMEFRDLDEMSRACAIAIDEVGIDNKYCYDVGNDQIYGGKDNACVVAVRSLFSNWKQIIQFDWENMVSKEDLLEIIKQLQAVGLNVYAVVTDMGTKNKGLWKDLKVGKVKKESIKKSWFLNPSTDERVWVFPDYPHLIKLLRNHLLDNGIHLTDGSILDKTLVQDLINSQKLCEFKLNPKLCNKTVYLRGKQRQNVATAFQLFSNKTAKAIKKLLIGRSSAADFVELINNFSDLMNSHVAEQSQNPYKSPYGKDLVMQNELLEKVYTCFTEITIGNRKKHSYAPFQKGILMGIDSMRGLFEDLKSKIGCTYILTAKLNQDYLENIFSQIRGMGGFCYNPTALEFKHRVKKLLVTKALAAPITASVRQEEDPPEMLSSRLLSVLTSNEGSARIDHYSDIMTSRMETCLTTMNWEIDVTDLQVDKFTKQQFCEEGGIEFVAGFIAKKFMSEYPEFSKFGAREGGREPFWVGFLSNYGLSEPSLTWHAIFKKFDEIFREVHPHENCNRKAGITSFLSDLLIRNYKDIPEDVIKYFVKVRTCIRVHFLNVQLQDEKYLRQERKRLAFVESNKCVAEVPELDVGDNPQDLNSYDSSLLHNLLNSVL